MTRHKLNTNKMLTIMAGLAALVGLIVWYFWSTKSATASVTAPVTAPTPTPDLFITKGSISTGLADYSVDQVIAATVQAQVADVPTTTSDLPSWQL